MMNLNNTTRHKREPNSNKLASALVTNYELKFRK